MRTFLVVISTMLPVPGKYLARDGQACPMRDVTCADGHENVVSVLFSVDAAEVSRF